MKKFSIALMALILCFSMVVGVSAAEGSNVAEPITTQEIPSSQSTEEVLGDFVEKAIGDNQAEVDDATDAVEGFTATITKLLNALDDFLRSIRGFVDQFLSRVLGNGSLPF